MVDVVIIHQNDGSDTRIVKLCRTLSKKYSVKFLGWDKTGSLASLNKANNVGEALRELFIHHTKNGRGTIKGFLLFVLWVWKIIVREKPKVIYCVNEELTFFIFPVKYIVGASVVCDIFDAFGDRNSTSVFSSLYRFIQHAARFFSDRVVVTDNVRYDRLLKQEKQKSIVIDNFPECDRYPSLVRASETNSDQICLSFVGSISDRRGVKHLTECLKYFENLKIVCAGWLYDESAKNFVRMPRIKYYGIILPEDARELMRQSDAVFCIYDPKVVNNIYASPNKLYDAITLGKPVIINRETLVSKEVERMGVGLTFEYGNINTLYKCIDDVQKNKNKKKWTLSKKYRRNFCWEKNEPKLYSMIDSLLNDNDEGCDTIG